MQHTIKIYDSRVWVCVRVYTQACVCVCLNKKFILYLRRKCGTRSERDFDFNNDNDNVDDSVAKLPTC